MSATGIAFHDRDTNKASQKNFYSYLRMGDDGKVTWKDETAKGRLLVRISLLYTHLFAAMRLQGVRVPILIPIGCGAFWPTDISEEIASELAELYFTAQIHKAVEGASNGWFDAVLLNPTRFENVAKAVVTSCNMTDDVKAALILHNKESLSLVESLQDQFPNLSMGIVNPSDPLCLVTRCPGYWWEHGIDEMYVGEEFIASFTTLCSNLLNRGDETIVRVPSNRSPPPKKK